MPTFTEVQGDLFTNGERVIAHGCNCLGLMGAGVARIIAERFPIALVKNKRAVEAGVFVLGYAQFVIDDEHDQCIYNLATQKMPGANASRTGVKLAFMNMFEHAKANGIGRVAIPQIGCGIGGLLWDEVECDIRGLLALDSNNPDVIAYYL